MQFHTYFDGRTEQFNPWDFGIFFLTTITFDSDFGYLCLRWICIRNGYHGSFWPGDFLTVLFNVLPRDCTHLVYFLVRMADFGGSIIVENSIFDIFVHTIGLQAAVSSENIWYKCQFCPWPFLPFQADRWHLWDHENTSDDALYKILNIWTFLLMKGTLRDPNPK